MNDNKIIEILNKNKCPSSLFNLDNLNLVSLNNLDVDIPYHIFFENHLLTNKPCLIRNVGSSWSCSKTWVSDNSINFDYFINEYGELEAPIADCDTISYNSHCKEDMKVKEYMNYAKNVRKRKLYLKDWHLQRLKPNDKFYEVPNIFASDWLNEYALDHQEDDFMFVYIGPSGSWTPLHVDVYSSYSWSVNIVGLKKWILFPPGEETKLKDSHGNLPLLFSPEKFKNVQYIEIIQDRGDAIFVPSGWHHQVNNIQDTISINHNWFNGCNINIVWKSLQENLELVENEIKEFKETPDFNSHCQLMLKSLFGMDYQMFFNLLLHIAEKRLSELVGDTHLIFNNYVLGKNHIKFDLKQILDIINDVVNEHMNYDKYLLSDIKDNLFKIHSQLLQNVR